MYLSEAPKFLDDIQVEFHPDILRHVYTKMQEALPYWPMEIIYLPFGKRNKSNIEVAKAHDIPYRTDALGRGLVIDIKERDRIIHSLEREGLDYLGGWHSHPNQSQSHHPSVPNDFSTMINQKEVVHVSGIARYDALDMDVVNFWPWKVYQYSQPQEVELAPDDWMAIFSNFTGKHAFDGHLKPGQKKDMVIHMGLSSRRAYKINKSRSSLYYKGIIPNPF